MTPKLFKTRHDDIFSVYLLLSMYYLVGRFNIISKKDTGIHNTFPDYKYKYMFTRNK